MLLLKIDYFIVMELDLVLNIVKIKKLNSRVKKKIKRERVVMPQSS